MMLPFKMWLSIAIRDYQRVKFKEKAVPGSPPTIWPQASTITLGSWNPWSFMVGWGTTISFLLFGVPGMYENPHEYVEFYMVLPAMVTIIIQLPMISPFWSEVLSGFSFLPYFMVISRLPPFAPHFSIHLWKVMGKAGPQTKVPSA